MKQSGIDFTSLDHKLNKKAYRLSDVKDQLEVVAFDVVRFRDPDKGAELWKVEEGEDGNKYIVALYQEGDKIASPWRVQLTKIGLDLQISYKGDPIVKVASAKLGMTAEQLQQIPQYLPAKLAENKKLVQSLLNELDNSAKNEVFKKYPELF